MPNLTHEQVFRILRQWYDEHSEWRVAYETEDVQFGSDCQILGISEQQIAFDVKPVTLPFQIRWAAFEFCYGDPKKCAQAFPDPKNRQYAACLLGDRPPKAILFLAKVKTS